MNCCATHQPKWRAHIARCPNTDRRQEISSGCAPENTFIAIICHKRRHNLTICQAPQSSRQRLHTDDRLPLFSGPSIPPKTHLMLFRRRSRQRIIQSPLKGIAIALGSNALRSFPAASPWRDRGASCLCARQPMSAGFPAKTKIGRLRDAIAVILSAFLSVKDCNPLGKALSH